MINRYSTRPGKRFASLDRSDQLNRYESSDYHSPIERETSESRSTPSKTVLPTLHNTKQMRTKRNFFKDSPEINTIQRYQKYFSGKEEHFQKKNLHEYKAKKRFTDDGMRVKTEINNLAKEIKEIRKSMDEDQHMKIDIQNRFFIELVGHLRERQSFGQQMPSPPQMVPIYVPFPINYPPQPQEQYRNPEDYKKRTTIKRYYGRGRHRSLALWKKAGHCILFIIYLKRFCKIARQTRKKVFAKFFKELPLKLGTVKEMIVRGLRAFMSNINQLSEKSLEIRKEDNPQSKAQKIKVVRKLVNLILQGLETEFKANQANPNHIQSLYYLCKHGNYSCTEPLLTKEELELTSISEAFHYVSADCNLQKSALINLLLVKLLLYNTLLSRNIEKQLKNKESFKNIRVIGSVLFEIMMDVQNGIMQEVPSTYPLGNYREEDQVRGLQSMVVGSGEAEQGKLISGLKESEWVRQSYKLTTWRSEKKSVLDLIDMQKQLIKKHHLKIIIKFK